MRADPVRPLLALLMVGAAAALAFWLLRAEPSAHEPLAEASPALAGGRDAGVTPVLRLGLLDLRPAAAPVAAGPKKPAGPSFAEDDLDEDADEDDEAVDDDEDAEEDLEDFVDRRVLRKVDARVERLDAGPRDAEPDAAPTPGRATFQVGHLKDALRRYHDGLPRGAMPENLELGQLLPPDLVRAIALPPGSRVVELAGHPTTSTAGLEAALKLSDVQYSTLPLVVVTPEGETVRGYVFAYP